MEDEDDESHRRLRTIFLIQGILHFVGGLMGPVYAVFVTTIGGDVFSAGVTYGVYMISMGISYVVFGRMADRLRARGLIASLGVTAQSLCIPGYLFVKTPIELGIVQVAMGFFGAMHVPSINALVSHMADRKKSATIWGSLESVEDISYGIASVTGATVAYYLGFHTLFISMSIIGLGAGTLLFREVGARELPRIKTLLGKTGMHPSIRIPIGTVLVALAAPRSQNRESPGSR